MTHFVQKHTVIKTIINDINDLCQCSWFSSAQNVATPECLKVLCYCSQFSSAQQDSTSECLEVLRQSG